MRSVEDTFRETISVKQAVLKDKGLLDRSRAASELMIASFSAGGRCFFIGNGGSAADAQHFAAELSGHFIFDRPPLPGEVLLGNPSHVTAVANDYTWETVASRALQASARSGDILVAISTSGNSSNVLAAARTAREVGVKVIAMTGQDGGELRHLADIVIDVPSSDTGRIQESHTTFLHAISEHVEAALFGHLQVR